MYECIWEAFFPSFILFLVLLFFSFSSLYCSMPFDNNSQLFSHSAALLLMLPATVQLNGMYSAKKAWWGKKDFSSPSFVFIFFDINFPFFSISSIHRNHIVVPVCAISEPNEHRREKKKEKRTLMWNGVLKVRGMKIYISLPVVHSLCIFFFFV